MTKYIQIPQDVFLCVVFFLILSPSGFGAVGGGDRRGDGGELLRCLGGLGEGGRALRALVTRGLPGRERERKLKS